MNYQEIKNVKRFADSIKEIEPGLHDHWIEYIDGTKAKSNESEIHVIWHDWIKNREESIKYKKDGYTIFEYKNR